MLAHSLQYLIGAQYFFSHSPAFYTPVEAGTAHVCLGDTVGEPWGPSQVNGGAEMRHSIAVSSAAQAANPAEWGTHPQPLPGRPILHALQAGDLRLFQELLKQRQMRVTVIRGGKKKYLNWDSYNIKIFPEMFPSL